MQRTEQRYVCDILDAGPGHMPVDRLVCGDDGVKETFWKTGQMLRLVPWEYGLNDDARHSTQGKG